MPPTPTTQQMGERHEKDVAEVLGGTMTRGSGNGIDKGDGAHHHDAAFAFRWDAKSTKGKQIAVTAAMLEKIIEQAGGERPALPLRWYGNEMLTKVLHDWIAVKLADFSELLADARETAALREQVKSLRAANASLEAYNTQAGEIISRQRRELETPGPVVLPLGDSPAPAPVVPGYLPRLPWTIIHIVNTPGGPQYSGFHYDAQGHQQTFDIFSVRVERSLGSSNRPRLIVNDTRVSHGTVYVDGKTETLACESDPGIEVG